MSTLRRASLSPYCFGALFYSMTLFAGMVADYAGGGARLVPGEVAAAQAARAGRPASPPKRRDQAHCRGNCRM